MPGQYRYSALGFGCASRDGVATPHNLTVIQFRSVKIRFKLSAFTCSFMKQSTRVAAPALFETWIETWSEEHARAFFGFFLFSRLIIVLPKVIGLFCEPPLLQSEVPYVFHPLCTIPSTSHLLLVSCVLYRRGT